MNVQNNMHPVGVTGEHAKTKADLRALHRETEQTYIPHEVKALWGEAHKGQHVVDLLRNVQTRDTVARPVAQILSYMVSHSKDGKNASCVTSGLALQWIARSSREC